VLLTAEGVSCLLVGSLFRFAVFEGKGDVEALIIRKFKPSQAKHHGGRVN